MKNLLFNNRKNLSGHHRGMTLVELLVVSAIMVILMSVSIPLLTPLAENRMNREAARGVQSALEAARARAIRLGRPCGVALVPFHPDWRFTCITLEQMTAPPSYEVKQLPSLQTNDMYQINGTGPYLSGNNPTKVGFNLTRNIISDDKVDYYLIHKFPILESTNAFAKALGIEASYTLPKGYVIDLHYSKIGSSDSDFKLLPNLPYTVSKGRPPIIVFGPDGSATAYISGVSIHGDIHLLVGEWGRIMTGGLGGNSMAEEGNSAKYSNYLVHTTYWVVINSKSGEIHCVRNLPNDSGNGNDTDFTNVAGGK